MSQQDVLLNEGGLPLTDEHVPEPSSNSSGTQDVEDIQERPMEHAPRSQSPIVTTLEPSSEESGEATTNDIKSYSTPQVRMTF